MEYFQSIANERLRVDPYRCYVDRLPGFGCPVCCNYLRRDCVADPLVAAPPAAAGLVYTLGTDFGRRLRFV